MSDPLDRLRDAPPSPRTPDLDAIRNRARRIDSRRRLTIGAVIGSALSGLVVVAIALAIRHGPQTPADVVQIPGSVSRPGGGQTTPAPTRAPDSSVAAGPEAARTTGGLEVRVEASAREVAQGESVTLTVSACNVSPTALTRTFDSGQRYDFEVTRGSSVLWQWSKDETFSRFAGRETWQPRECRTYAADWKGTDDGDVALAPGRYGVRAKITSADPASSGTMTICVGRCPN